MSRTVSDIVTAVQEQQPATDEELRHALLVLFLTLQMSCPSDYKDAGPMQLKMRAELNFERMFRMMKSNPTTYLGPRWTPGTVENAEGRATSKRIVEAFERSRK